MVEGRETIGRSSILTGRAGAIFRGAGLAVLIGLGAVLGPGCAEGVTLCKEVPLDGGRLEYPLGITWYSDLIVVSSSNARGEYCSGYLSLFTFQGDMIGTVPVATEEEEYSIFGEVQADNPRGYLYMTERQHDTLLVFRTGAAGPELMRSVPIRGENEDPRGGSDPFGLDVNRVSGDVAVTCSGSGEVVFFDAGAEHELGRVDLGKVRPIRVKYTPGGDRAWVAADQSNLVYRLELNPPRLGQEYESISTVTNLRARGIWMEMDGIYVVSGYPQAILLFDYENGFRGAIPLGEDVDPFDVKKWGGRVYVSSVERDEIWVIDGEEEKVDRIIGTAREIGGIEYGRGPSHLVLGPEDGMALVTNYKSGDVAILDLVENEVIGFFPPKEDEEE